MAVTVTDRRITLVQADSTATETWNTGTAHTATFAESTACIAVAYNIATGQIYATVTAFDMSNSIIYVQTQVIATQDSWTGGVHSLFLGDGTDQIAFHLAGNDRRMFSHSKDGPVGWQCFVLDGSQASAKNTRGETTVVAGSFAGLGLSAITQIGAHFITLSKALGGGVNCYVDIIRYGNHGIRITGGGIGTEGTFTEIVTEDKSTADGKAHGIIREYTEGIFGCQGPLTFGDSGVATNSYFADDGIVLAYENRDISNDKYYFAVDGHPAATNRFSLTSSTITTAGPYVRCNFAASGIDYLNINGCSFVGLGGTVNFANDVKSSGHFVQNSVFTACNIIDPGKVTFTSNTISSSVNAASGSLLIDYDGASNLSNLDFISSGAGHAIYLTASGVHAFNNFTYDGFGATGTTNACVYNNSGGAVVIQVVGGDTPTYRNGTSASTTVDLAVTFTIENIIAGSEVRIYDEDTAGRPELAGIEDSGTTFEYNYSASEAPKNVSVVVFNIDYKDIFLARVLPASNSTLTVFQIFDRNFKNP